MLDDRGAAVRRPAPKAASTGRPSGSVAAAPQDPPAARAHDRLHRALAAVGDRQQPRRPRRRPPAARGRSPPPPRLRVERALELVRARRGPAGVTLRAEAAPARSLPRVGRRRRRTRPARARCPRRGGAAPPRPRSAPPRRAGSRRRRFRTRPAPASARRARPPSRACSRVARRMMSAGRRPAELHRGGVDHPARGQAPRAASRPPRRARSARARRSPPGSTGPPARTIAPATPPPCASRVLAAFAIASTSSFVMSASRTSIARHRARRIPPAMRRRAPRSTLWTGCPRSTPLRPRRSTSRSSTG